jgi:hypothetical protein
MKTVRTSALAIKPTERADVDVDEPLMRGVMVAPISITL